MATHYKQALAVLQGDYSTKQGRIKDAAEAQQKPVKSALAEARKAVETSVQEAITKVVAKARVTAGENDIALRWSDRTSNYGHFILDSGAIPAVKKRLDQLSKMKAEEMDALEKLATRFRNVRRALLLHGMTPEVVKLVEDFAKAK